MDTAEEAWRRYLREAEDAYELAADRQMGLWISEHRLSEGYLEAVERTNAARSRMEAHLVAYNAWSDWQNR
jgi:hypothetical protein